MAWSTFASGSATCWRASTASSRVVDQQGVVGVEGLDSATPFESSIIAVEELDGVGRVARVDLYDEDQLVEALDRYDAIAATSAGSTRPGAGSGSNGCVHRTPTMMASSLTPDVRIEDHRTLIGLPADGIDDVLERWNQMQQDTSLQVTSDLLATRGERFALVQQNLRGTWGLSGEVEQSFLSITELDDDDRTARIAFFDLEERERAYATLDEWYLAGRELSWPTMLSSEDDYGANVLEKAFDVPRGGRRARGPPAGRLGDGAGTRAG